MTDYSELLSRNPFEMEKHEKSQALLEGLISLSQYHATHCSEYGKILENLNVDLKHITKIEDIPFIPVRLFKLFDLMSIPKDQVFKTMTSSGTTGQRVSKIFLDKDTALNQQKTLVKIVSTFTGISRTPMLVIDSPSVVKDRKMFSARGAGILGFSIFGSNVTYALNDDMSINLEATSSFLEKHKGKSIFIFGFTFMIWQYFLKELINKNCRFDMSSATLVHGGGWKKLASESISNETFRKTLKDVAGISRIHDYYGMVEQTGCIYMECEHGYLHASHFSDIIIRRSKDFAVCNINERGLIQLLSLLPKSYPGHSILTEDEGTIIGEDDCQCGRKGKYFKIFGRIKNAELRGCSDTHEQR